MLSNYSDNRQNCAPLPVSCLAVGFISIVDPAMFQEGKWLIWLLCIVTFFYKKISVFDPSKETQNLKFEVHRYIVYNFNLFKVFQHTQQTNLKIPDIFTVFGL